MDDQWRCAMTSLRLLMAVLMLGGSLGLASCAGDSTGGPAENTGEAIDEGVSDAGRAIEDAVD